MAQRSTTATLSLPASLSVVFLLFLPLLLLRPLPAASTAPSDNNRQPQKLLLQQRQQQRHEQQQQQQQLQQQQQQQHLQAFIEGELRSDPSLASLVELEERFGQEQSDRQSDETFLTAGGNEQSLLQIAQAKSRLASRVAAYLSMADTELRAEPYNGLSEPSNNCRTLLNTWMATCVFG